MQKNSKLDEIKQACHDACNIDFERLYTNDDYSLHKHTIGFFISSLPRNERALLKSNEEDLAPTILAHTRAQAAFLLKGYSNAKVVHQAYLCHSPDGRYLLNVLTAMGGPFADLAYVNDGLDIRDIIVNAFLELIAFTDSGVSLETLRANMKDEGLAIKAPENYLSIAIKEYIVRNSETPDKLSGFFEKLVGELIKAEHINKPYEDETESSDDDEFFDDDDEDDFFDDEDDFFDDEDGSSDDDYEDDTDEDAAVDISVLYTPKMSPYMQKFWEKHGTCFFDDKTRKKFLEDLKRYREKIEKLM